MPESVIHLSYYAMLHAAVAVLIVRQGQAPKTHGSIIGQFSLLVKAEDERGRTLGRAFNRAEDRRLAADYADHATPTAAAASRTCTEAREFVDYCSQLIERP